MSPRICGFAICDVQQKFACPLYSAVLESLHFCQNMPFFHILNYQSSELDVKNGSQMQIFFALEAFLKRSDNKIKVGSAHLV
jgi:hypothetical protein